MKKIKNMYFLLQIIKKIKSSKNFSKIKNQILDRSKVYFSYRKIFVKRINFKKEKKKKRKRKIKLIELNCTIKFDRNWLIK